MSNVWYEVGKALRLLIQGTRAGQKRQNQAPRSTSRSTQRQTSKNRGSAGAPTPTPPRTGPPGTNGANTSPADVRGGSSPGQFGVDQTRDLNPQELRRANFEYAPNPDGDPDPGEIIWTWVPYIENDGRGKDRPVLIIGRIDAKTVVGCYLTTKYRHEFISIGSGQWDPQGRESFLSPERLLRITHEGMRRESVQIDRERFDDTVANVLAFHTHR